MHDEVVASDCDRGDAAGSRSRALGTGDASSEPLAKLFDVDLRSLAAFRIALASLLLVNAAQRGSDLEAHFSDRGVLVRADLFWLQIGELETASLHALSGTAGWQAGLLLLSVAAAIALGLGWRTRLATILSWGLLVSLQARNPLVLNGGDIVLRLLLFWSMFLPLAEYASWDARARAPTGSATPECVRSLAAAALLIQVALIYPVAAIFKLRQPVWLELEGFGAAMQVDGVATGFGQLLAGLPLVSGALSGGVLLLEGLGPLLAFSPWATSRLRLVAVLFFAAFHLIGIGSTLRVGLFPFVMAVAWLPFLPSAVWRIAPRRAPGGPCAIAPRRAHPLSDFLAGAIGLTVLWHNAATLGWLPGDASGPPGILRTIHAATGLSQRWSLWSDPPSNRYFLVVATTADGDTVDLRREGRPLDWTRPRPRSRNARWWKLELSLSDPDFAPLRRGYGCYWLRRWNREQPVSRAISEAEGWMLEGTRHELAAGRARRHLLWRVEAGSAPSARVAPSRRAQRPRQREIPGGSCEAVRT